MPKIKVSSGSYDGAGRFIPGCKVTILDAGTSDLSTLYSDQAGTALGNPFTADESGTWEFYSDPGLFDIHVQRRGSAIFVQESVAIGYVPYAERPGGTWTASSSITSPGAFGPSSTPYILGVNSPDALPIALGQPPYVRMVNPNPEVVVEGVEFEAVTYGATPSSDFEFVALKYTGDLVRDFICYFTITHYPTFAGSQGLTVVTVDGDDWEAGTYTQKTASDTITYTWDATRTVAYSRHMQVVVMHVEPGDVVVPLIYMQDSFLHYIPDVSLAINP
jgi:hypothetical protein